MTISPTNEQAAVLDAFHSGGSVAVEALAGTGKSSSLELLARSTQRAGTYVAFNRAVVNEAAARFPMNVSARTVHSLARARTGNIQARLDAGRMTSRDLAGHIGTDKIIVQTPGKPRVLTAGFVASLAMKAIRSFCYSADLVPGAQHVPYVEGIDERDQDGNRTYKMNRQVADYVAGFLPDIWADLSEPDGKLPYSHDVYVKQFELAGPAVAGDFVLADECQPPGTMVETPTGAVPIESLQVGDRVVSYSQSSVKMRRSGNRVLGITRRPFADELIDVTTSTGKSTSFTPNHICLVRGAQAFDGKAVLYLMRRGKSFRVGVTRKTVGARAWAGVKARMSEEGADAAWVLDLFDNRGDALIAEREIVADFGVPNVVFNGKERAAVEHFNVDRLTSFWNRRGDLTDAATRLLAHFGRDIRYPFVETGHHVMLRRVSKMRACNVLDGMRMLDVDEYVGPLGAQPDAWVTVTTKRRPYRGDVYSLDVETNHAYVADGIVTHNCQDLSPVMLSIVGKLAADGMQVVFVGDSYQQLYEWRGAVNAFDHYATDHHLWLTQSFRFGPAIADAANHVLAGLGSPAKLSGLDSIRSTIGFVNQPDAILSRSNAAAVSTMLLLLQMGHHPHLVGGGADVMAFARAAIALQHGQWQSHPDLACFSTWSEVQDYVSSDPQGDDLSLMVHLLDEYGAQIVLDALEGMPAEQAADVVLSTTHKAKGREWGRVRLAADFHSGDPLKPDPAELRLLYVGATRARDRLDPRLCEPLTRMLGLPSHDATPF